jgi:hypothetical protein
MTSSKRTVYEEHGYPSREAYLRCVAEDYGVDLETVQAVADLLGEDEDFDGLLVSLGE